MINFLIYTDIFQYVPIVYNKLYLKQVNGNFPGSVHNKQSAEISSVMNNISIKKNNVKKQYVNSECRM